MTLAEDIVLSIRHVSFVCLEFALTSYWFKAALYQYDHWRMRTWLQKKVPINESGGALQLPSFLVANSTPGETGSSRVFQPETGAEETHQPADVWKQRHSCQETILCQANSCPTTARQKRIPVGFLGCPCVVCNWCLCPDQPLPETTLLLGAGHFTDQTRLAIRSVTSAV